MQRRVSLGVGERYPCESVRHARIVPGMFMPRLSVCPRVQFPEVVWLITRRTAKCGHISCLCACILSVPLRWSIGIGAP